MQEEIWKDIEGFDGDYRVSTLGRVMGYEKSWVSGEFGNIIKTLPDRLILLSNDKDGYEKFPCRSDGKNKNFKVHRVVAMAFIPNPHNKPQVNHINGIKHDNRVENLEWSTAKENINHAWKTGLSKVNPHSAFGSLSRNKFGGTIGSRLVLDTSTGIYYLSAKEAHEAFNFKFSIDSLSCRLLGKVKNRTNLIYAD